jgi:type I restriction enzyme S subunit
MKFPWSSIDFIDSIRKTNVGRENQILASEIQPSGLFPVVDQGKDFIAGYSDAEERVIRDDIPVVIFGDHTRCLKYVDFPFILGADGTKVLKPREDLFDTKFFYYALLGLDIPNRGYNRHFTLLKEKKILYPEKDEQKKIAIILTVLEQAIEQQERIIQVTTELKKALMQKLFTEGLRGEPQKQTEIGPVPESWEVVSLGDYLTEAQYGLSVKGSDTGQYGLLRMTNQQQGIIILDNLQYVSLPPDQFSKFRLQRQDLLFNRTNSFDLVGRTAIFDLEGDFAFASYLIKLRTNSERLRPYFLNHYSNWEKTQARLKSIASRAVSQSNISATRLRGFPIPAPSPEEQDEIIANIDCFDRKLAIHQGKHVALTDLFHNLLNQLMTVKIRIDKFDLSIIEKVKN